MSAEDPQYFDTEGKPIPLWRLCRDVPEWATSRIRTLILERDEARADAVAWMTAQKAADNAFHHITDGMRKRTAAYRKELEEDQ